MIAISLPLRSVLTKGAVEQEDVQTAPPTFSRRQSSRAYLDRRCMTQQGTICIPSLLPERASRARSTERGQEYLQLCYLIWIVPQTLSRTTTFIGNQST